MIFVVEGTPDLWVDGYTYRSRPEDAAGWPGRDGRAHCLINNTDKPVRILTIGEASRCNSHIHFPLTREMDEWLEEDNSSWTERSRRKLGPTTAAPTPRARRATPRS